QADVRTVFRSPKHPYTQKLLRAIPAADSAGENLEEIPGSVPRLINPPSGCRFHPRCDHATSVCSEKKPIELEVSPGHTVACHLF
ncbi:ABC transporter ATP-binding protein, partial [Candidatus Bipolaricaulota bacterium]|nr:ABC transporter ATP-binding protein [Candidatus Bipolaricaulota bacterium]